MLPFFGIFYTTFTVIISIILYLVVRKFYSQYEQDELKLIEKYTRKSRIGKEEVDRYEEIEESALEKSFNYIPAAHSTMDIGFENLGLKSKSGTTFLEGVSGFVKSGEMLVVMGPSGCGKSSFLHTLAGRAHYGKPSGKIYVNGEEVTNLRAYKEHIGFVPQDDVMLRILTVKEVLEFAAKMRSKKSHERKVLLVEEILGILDISHVRFSKIGDESDRGISGGQRKRINVGIELISKPSLLFLDEPTSGLDSSSSKSICATLKELSSSGLTVIAVLHQPRYEIFEMFDKVLLLGKGGKTVYFGPTKDVEAYFEKLGYPTPTKVNPPDFYMDVISGAIDAENFDPQRLVDTWIQYENKSMLEGNLLKIEEKPKLQSVTLSGLRNVEYWRNLAICFFTSIFGFFVILLSPRIQHGAFFGAITGYLLSLVVIKIALLIYGIPILSMYIGLLLLFNVMSIIYIQKKHLCKQSPGFVGGLIVGIFSGPVGVVATLFQSFLLPRDRSAIRFGCVALILMSLIFWYPATVIKWRKTLTPTVQAVSLGVALWAMTALIALHHHFSRLPTSDHKTPNFFYQTWNYFVRGIIQQLRDWKGIVFDLTLVIFASLFLGVIFYQQSYEGSFFEPFGASDPCPTKVRQFFPSICLFLSVPTNDPLPGQASLSILALSLCAVASSLRVFGSEKLQFKREVSGGLSPEAYFIGKNLAHLPIVMLAPFLFLVNFYSLAVIQAPFWQHYSLFFLVYFASAGIAYTVSILIKPSNSQLVAVLVVLSNITFSGSNPTLVQLKNNGLMHSILIYPTYPSFIRWANEIYYLLEIKTYATARASNFFSMTTIFGYTVADIGTCWVSLIVIALVFRTFAYMAIVKQEE